jgi:CDP-glucose 4,6-dehydratase
MDMKKIIEMYAGRRVFITGHTGFKGSWLSFILHEAGAKVAGFSLEPATEINHFSLLNLEKKIHHIIGDIRNEALLTKEIEKFQPDYVFHLAAQALVRPSYDNPVETFSTNVIGSVNLLEAVRRCKSVRSLVYITSDKCYENVEWLWGYRENDRLGGRDPYSASKAAAELVFASYASSFFLDRPLLGAATTRAGNVIGGGDWAKDRIIPDCIRSIDSGLPILLRNPNATRPWQHVLEPIAGYLLLASKLYIEPRRWEGSWNFGPSTSEVKTVEQVAQIIVDELGRGSIETPVSLVQYHEANLLQLNCDKAHQLLGWYPRWNSDETLKATAYWYKKFLEGDDVEGLTRYQVQKFFQEEQ